MKFFKKTKFDVELTFYLFIYLFKIFIQDIKTSVFT